jgi:predicted nucleic acid-binding protein
MWLLDTNVVSEVRKPRPHPAVLAWLSARPASSMRLAAVTFGELQREVELTRKPNPEKAEAIGAWVDHLTGQFEVIPADVAVYRLWAKLTTGRSPHLAADGLVAATAQVHGLTVVSRNVRDFEAFGMTVVNPFEPAV